MKMSFPEIYTMSKLNKKQCWKIHVCDDYYFTETFQCEPKEGKHRFSNKTYCLGKNIGKKNETTPQQQAYNEALALWNKKSIQNPRLFPMLAHKYNERGQKYLQEPFAVSPKLDGIRSIAHRLKNTIELYSRNGKIFPFLLHIKRELMQLSHRRSNLILDGELYAHDIPFNTLSGLIRTTKEKPENDDKVQYWIFDIISDKPYLERMIELRELFQKHSFQYIYIVDYQECLHKDVHKYHCTFVEQGFEGLIARNLNQPYEINTRSNHLLKYKEFEEEEFKIIGYKLGIDGGIIFECIDGKHSFHVKPRGSLSFRTKLYKHAQQHVGELLTVRFQHRDVVPRFPVGISIRNYE